MLWILSYGCNIGVSPVGDFKSEGPAVDLGDLWKTLWRMHPKSKSLQRGICVPTHLGSKRIAWDASGACSSKHLTRSRLCGLYLSIHLIIH